MVHVSASCNPNFHATGAHYINADTTAFMQFIQADLFKDFPALRMIIPHGGGAVPYSLGPLPRLAQDMKRPCSRTDPQQRVLRHLRVSPGGHRSAAEDRAGRQHPVRIGDGGRGARHRSETGNYYDDTKRYIDAASISSEARVKIFEGNARKVYPDQQGGSGVIDAPPGLKSKTRPTLSVHETNDRQKHSTRGCGRHRDAWQAGRRHRS
jgi:4-oxalmesaconate hydratase